MEEMVVELNSGEPSTPGSDQGVANAWESVTAALVSPGSSLSEQDRLNLSLLCSHGLGRLLGVWLLESLQVRLSSSVVPEFWSGLEQPQDQLEERDRAGVLLSAFQTLLDQLDPFLSGLEQLGAWQAEGRCGLSGPGPGALQDRAFTTIRALLLFSPPAVLQQRVLEFYSRTFSVYMSREGGEDGAEALEGPDGGACPGCRAPASRCWCPEALQQLQQLSLVLSRLQLLEWVSAEAVTAILHRLIEQRMEQHCRGEYERSFLQDFQEVRRFLHKMAASAALFSAV